MPTLGVCTDSVLETNGPLVLLNLLESAPRGNRIIGQKKDPRTRNLKRRACKRADFSYRLLIRPLESSVDQNADSLESEAMYVTGKDISEIGFGFFHENPFPYRRALVEAADDRLDAIGLGDMSLELTIRWCRFIGQGQYESGSRVSWLA